MTIQATKTTLHDKPAISIQGCTIHHRNKYKGVVTSYDISLGNAINPVTFPASTMQYNKDGTITFQLWIFKKKFPNIEIVYGNQNNNTSQNI